MCPDKNKTIKNVDEENPIKNVYEIIQIMTAWEVAKDLQSPVTSKLKDIIQTLLLDAYYEQDVIRELFALRLLDFSAMVKLFNKKKH